MKNTHVGLPCWICVLSRDHRTRDGRLETDLSPFAHASLSRAERSRTYEEKQTNERTKQNTLSIYFSDVKHNHIVFFAQFPFPSDARYI